VKYSSFLFFKPCYFVLSELGMHILSTVSVGMQPLLSENIKAVSNYRYFMTSPVLYRVLFF